MAYNRITWAPSVLRAAGITVVEHKGWKERGLSPSARRFEPSFIVWHHDASARGDSPSVPQSMINRFDTAGAQLWIDRKGVWHIIASGRAPHAGKTLPGMPENENSIGIETDHTTGEDWPPALLASLRKGTAALFNHMNQSASKGLHFHKTICSPRGRKVDPDGLNLTTERARVGAIRIGAKAKPIAEKVIKPKNNVEKGHALALPMLAAFRQAKDRDVVERELAVIVAALDRMPDK